MQIEFSRLNKEEKKRALTAFYFYTPSRIQLYFDFVLF